MTNENYDYVSETYEEIFRGHEIYIEPNPDRYRGGSVWSICKGEDELESDVEPSAAYALAAARAAIEKLDADVSRDEERI